MRGYLFVLIAGCAFAWAASTSRRSAADAGSESGGGQDTSNPPEPITGEVAVPNAAPTSVPRDPFSAYGVGETIPNETDPAWTYQQLNSAEQAVVDQGRAEGEAAKWSAIHDGYKSAVALRAVEAAAQAAAIRLGIEALQEGVIP